MAATAGASTRLMSAKSSSTRFFSSSKSPWKIGGINGGCKRVCGGGLEKKSRVVVNAVVMMGASSEGTVITTTIPETKQGISSEGVAVDLRSFVTGVANAALTVLRLKLIKRRNKKKSSWKHQAEMLIETGVVDCRFFALFAVGGSLLGSILCFFEGCFLVLQSYYDYFQAISHSPVEEGHVNDVMHHLIEAIDMFLMGSALIIFGMGLYSLFVNQKNGDEEDKGLFPKSNLFGLFHLKALPTWVELQCISQAKSKIGHAVLMILQVGVLDKFKNVPLVTGLDLACFAGAVLISSACIFLLSKLSLDRTQCGR